MRLSPFLRSFCAAAIIALPLITAPHSARAQSLFFSGLNGEFGTLNVTNGATVRLGSTTYNNATVVLGGLANAANGNLYGLESNIYQSGSAAVLRLFQVSRTNGALSLVGAVSAFTNSNSSGYAQIGNTSDGTVYATYSPNLFNTNQTLYTLNTATAAATQVGTGNTGYKFDGGLVGDSSGKLFGFAGYDYGNPDYSISRTSGAATLLQSNAGGGSIGAAGFTNNNVYALNSSGGIYTLNTSTGAMTSTGLSYNTSVVSLILGAANVTPFATPEPGTLPLVGMGLVTGLGMVNVARRRRKSSTKPAA